LPLHKNPTLIVLLSFCFVKQNQMKIMKERMPSFNASQNMLLLTCSNIFGRKKPTGKSSLIKKIKFATDL